jgi:hypothetical protein
MAPFSPDRKEFLVPPVPWRETHLPMLVNGREGSLMNHIQFVNQCHLVSLQKVQSLLSSRKEPFNVALVYEFVIDSAGKLVLQYSGTQPKERRTVQRSRHGEQIMPGTKLGVKRERPDDEFNKFTKEVETTYVSSDDDSNEKYKLYEQNQAMIIYKTMQRRKMASRLSKF